MKDIIVLVADGTMLNVIEALLQRIPFSSNTRDFASDVINNIGHDSGCYNDAHEFLRPFINQYHYALVIFDKEGCGSEDKKRVEIEDEVQALLNKNGWLDRSSVVVIDPELENWIWQNSPHVERAFGWEEATSMYKWCLAEGILAHGDQKPIRPKETMHKILRKTRTSISSSIYKKIAQTCSYKNCTDLAFIKFINQLELWFKVP